MKNPNKTAILALDDGRYFDGIAMGAVGESVGELVFNTSMTGYQEILTDPSYAKQIITFTTPHIGNVGTNQADFESEKVWAAGCVIRDLPNRHSNWRAEKSLQQFLCDQQVVGIAGIDTRALTHILREEGAKHACIMSEAPNPALAIEKAKGFGGLNHQDLTPLVTTQKTYSLKPPQGSKGRIAVLDFGVKKAILDKLLERGSTLSVFPATTPPDIILKMAPDGIVLSNGPGDPAACHQIIENIKPLLTAKIPLLGICLGCQLLALAMGGKTTKMKFGHHGANHPVENVQTGRVFISSQNHGFMIDPDSLPSGFKVTHLSLFDKSIQGIAHESLPLFGFQGHPEASPGPRDLDPIFDEFVNHCKVLTAEAS